MRIIGFCNVKINGILISQIWVYKNWYQRLAKQAVWQPLGLGRTDRPTFASVCGRPIIWPVAAWALPKWFTEGLLVSLKIFSLWTWIYDSKTNPEKGISMLRKKDVKTSFLQTTHVRNKNRQSDFVQHHRLNLTLDWIFRVKCDERQTFSTVKQN